MKMRYRYIHFIETHPLPKTSVYLCLNNASEKMIAVVKWHSSFHGYSFFPEFDTVYSFGCLQDIVHFLNQLRGVKSHA